MHTMDLYLLMPWKPWSSTYFTCLTIPLLVPLRLLLLLLSSFICFLGLILIPIHASVCLVLQVLYRFLEFFSKFDWDNFCVSLWGPVPISSLPDVTGLLQSR